MRLSDFLAGRPPEVPVLVDQQGGSLEAGEIGFVRHSESTSAASIVATSARTAIRAILATDGVFEQVFVGCRPTSDHVDDVIVIDDSPAVWVGSAEARPAVDTSWIFETSGTTGDPKLVSHPLDSLVRTVRQGNEGAPRWGLLYGWSRFAGFQVVLQALASGGVILAPDLQRPIDDQVRFLKENGCDHLSATPTLWRRLLMSPSVGQLRLSQVTLGGEIVDQRTLDALRTAFPEAHVTHIFAATESGTAFAVRDGLEGFPAAFLEDPPRGIELGIREGRLLIRNDRVSPRYLATVEEFATDGWVDTGDLVELQGDRYIFLGRASGVINVGGNKVHPEVVERAVMEHPDVLLARVVARPSPILGSLLTVEVVPSDATRVTSDLPKVLMVHCREVLPRYMVPAKVKVVQTLELNEGGKVVRR